MYHIYFDDREMQVLAQILDAAARAGGLNAVAPVAYWQQKLVGAVEQSQGVYAKLEAKEAQQEASN